MHCCNPETETEEQYLFSLFPYEDSNREFPLLCKVRIHIITQ